METPKIKNLIIIVLLIVNIALGSVVAVDAIGRRRTEARALRGAEEILAEHGVAVAPGALRGTDELKSLSVQRGTAAEAESVAKLLGGVSVSDQGGNILFYSGGIGEAVFRGTGGFEVLFTEARDAGAQDPEAAARAAAKKLGLEISRSDSAVSAQLDDSGDGTLTLLCAYDGVDVVNCRVTFTFSKGNLLLIEGTRVLEASSSLVQAEILDIPTVLMRFLEIINDGGYICSELKSVGMCYLQDASASGAGRLCPVWRVVTDAGEFCFDAVSGKLVTDVWS